MSIVSHKPQTTRHRILGILNEDAYQIIFSDSPGIIGDPGYELHKSMNKYAYSSLEDADVLILMTDAFEDEIFNESLLSSVKKAAVPVFLVVNKIDIGETIGDLLLVNEGLQAGDKVVLDALQKVRSGMEVKPELTQFESQTIIKD